MHSTVFRAAERLQGPASRGLPEQSRRRMRRGKMRRVSRARAPFQNQKSETPAGTPTSGPVDEAANPVWGWVESRAKVSRAAPRESDGQFQGLLLLPGSMPAGRGLGLPAGEGHTECSLPGGASKAFI